MELVCNQVTKRFGSVVALSNATMTIKTGEVRALVGGNGSGKSTLSKILGGILYCDEGEITMDGERYEVSSPKEAKAKGIIMTSQELSLLNNLTVEENMCLCDLDVKGGFVDRSQMRKRTREVLKLIGKEELLNLRIDKMPANEKYLLELAKALIQKPQVLIVDEVTSALYKSDVEVVEKLLNQLKEEGVIVLFISHRLNEVFAFCDTVTVLRNGDTVGTFQVKDLDENTLISYMSGRDITEEIMVSDSIDESDLEIVLRTGKVHLPRFHKEVELDVHKSEFIGVAGLDGQGQTTFLRSLFGLESTVNVEFDGKPLTISSPRKAVKAGFAFVSGDREKEGTFKERSIAENFAVVSDMLLKKKPKNIDDYLKKAGVKYNRCEDLIISLSGGNQQKVVIARWTSSNPKIILADDPTKGIDIQARRDVHETFRQLLDKGSSVVMISSDDEELVETSKMMPLSRIIVMYEGEIVKTLRGSEITVENIAAYSSGKQKCKVG
ncbi:sugar ABC transporter ATP-binding protein [Blautia schinkii]|nr:sugar ABC transporter ATP-binding protein [Blautia schinkii]